MTHERRHRITLGDVGRRLPDEALNWGGIARISDVFFGLLPVDMPDREAIDFSIRVATRVFHEFESEVNKRAGTKRAETKGAQ